MNKIKIFNMLDYLVFCILSIFAVVGIIEKDKSFIWYIGLLLVLFMLGVVTLVIYSFLLRRERLNEIIEFIYKGKLQTLIEELRFTGIYFYRQIGDVYIFDTKRLISPNIRLLVTKEEKQWFISCDEYSLKRLRKINGLSLFAEQKMPDNTAKRISIFDNINLIKRMKIK